MKAILAVVLAGCAAGLPITSAHAECEGLQGSDFTRCKNAQGQREIGGLKNPSPVYTPSTSEPTPSTTYKPTPSPQTRPSQSARTEPAEPITLSQDFRTLRFETLGRTALLPPMGIKDYYASGWWPDGSMQPVVLRAQQGAYKYEVGILIGKVRCEAARQRAATWLQRKTEQDRSTINYRTFDNRDFDPRWFREYSAWLDQKTTQTEFCLDAPGGTLMMKVRAFETDTFDSEAIRALTKNLADALLPS